MAHNFHDLSNEDLEYIVNEAKQKSSVLDT